MSPYITHDHSKYTYNGWSYVFSTRGPMVPLMYGIQHDGLADTYDPKGWLDHTDSDHIGPMTWAYYSEPYKNAEDYQHVFDYLEQFGWVVTLEDPTKGRWNQSEEVPFIKLVKAPREVLDSLYEAKSKEISETIALKNKARKDRDHRTTWDLESKITHLREQRKLIRKP